MAFFDSKVSEFLLDDTGGTQRDLSGYTTDLRGLPGVRALNEVTALGDSGAKFIPGLEDVTILLGGIFDDTATSGPDAVLVRSVPTPRRWTSSTGLKARGPAT